MKNPLSEERIARDGHLWSNETIATCAWRKAKTSHDEVAIYLENEPAITYGDIAGEALRLVTGLRGLGDAAGRCYQLPAS